MFEKIKIIRKIRKLKEIPANSEFLLSLRSRLESRINLDLDMALIEQNGREGLFSRKRGFLPSLFGLGAKMMSIPAIASLIVILAGGGVAFAAQSSLPGDRLFSVKILGEEARQALALSPASKAALNIKFASKRINEVKDILEQRGVEPRGLDIALSRFEDNASRAAAIIDEETRRGKNMGNLKKMSDEAFDKNRAEVKAIFDFFREKNDALEIQERELESEIRNTVQEKNSNGDRSAMERLLETKEQRNLLENEKERARTIFDSVNAKRGSQGQPEFKSEDTIEGSSKENGLRTGGAGEQQEDKKSGGGKDEELKQNDSENNSRGKNGGFSGENKGEEGKKKED